MVVKCVVCVCDLDAGIRGHESRVDRERVAAQSRSTSVPQLLHGVFGGRAHAGPPHQEGPQSAFKNGGQLSQVNSPRSLASNLAYNISIRSSD